MQKIFVFIFRLIKLKHFSCYLPAFSTTLVKSLLQINISVIFNMP